MTKPRLKNKLVMMTKTDDFSSVFSFRKRYASHFMVVHFKPNQHVFCRQGFIVAKKVAKQAVKRNYMRRVLRELCRQELAGFGQTKVDLIIQVLKPFNQKDYQAVQQELAALFVKIQRKIAPETTKVESKA